MLYSVHIQGRHGPVTCNHTSVHGWTPKGHAVGLTKCQAKALIKKFVALGQTHTYILVPEKQS